MVVGSPLRLIRILLAMKLCFRLINAFFQAIFVAISGALKSLCQFSKTLETGYLYQCVTDSDLATRKSVFDAI